jgi:hypothetical protein
MKTTIKINGTTYTLSSGRATYETKHLTEEQHLQLRVNAVTLLANKKHRKPALKKCLRVYPKFGAILSTAAYVRDYYLVNANKFVSTDAKGQVYGEKNFMDGFFQPLSTRISVPMGEYTKEQDA